MTKAHSTHRLLASLYSKPHLISKVGFDTIQSYLTSRSLYSAMRKDKKKCDDGECDPCEGDCVEDQEPTFDAVLGIGVISVHGPLTYRKTGWEAMCGGYSYQEFLEETEEMLMSGIKTVILDADSGGGEAYACFETADEFRSLLDKYGAKAYGYVDGSACSAMYALICACDEVISNPQAETGSIGVLVALCNDSEHLKMEGYQRVFVTDGDQKVPFDDSGEFKKEFLDDLQTKVSDLGTQFRAHVTKYTGVGDSELKALQARVLSSKEALAVGLVNDIMTRKEFMSYVLKMHKENNA